MHSYSNKVHVDESWVAFARKNADAVTWDLPPNTCTQSCHLFSPVLVNSCFLLDSRVERSRPGAAAISVLNLPGSQFPGGRSTGMRLKGKIHLLLR